jgi:phage-related holin
VDLLNRITDMLRRGFEMLIECWAVKLLFSWASAVWVYLFGGAGAILGVVTVEIILDTLTKWAAIIKRYLIDQGHKPDEITVTAMLCGFLYAWKPGYLMSAALKRCWAEKIFCYGILIVFAGGMSKLPDITLFGLPINKSISGGIYTYIAMTELFSIMENLEEMGNTKLARLKGILTTLANRLGGNSFSVTVQGKQNDSGGEGQP